MNFLALKTAVQNITGINSSVGNYINNAQLDLAKKTKRIKTQTVTATNGLFTLPSNVLIAQKFAWDHVELDMFDGDILPSLSEGTPIYWKQYDTEIHLLPIATGNVEIIYTPRPATMSENNDIPEILDCDQVLIAYAIWQIYTDQEDVKADLWGQKWLNEVELWQQLDDKSNKRARRVRASNWR